MNVPSGVIADMAMRLAEQRAVENGFDWAKGLWTDSRCRPSPREVCEAGGTKKYPVSLEYYAIIDRISRGEKP